MRLNLKLDNKIVAYKESKKKSWILFDENYLLECLKEEKGNISSLVKRCNMGRKCLTDVLKLSSEANKIRNKSKRQVKSKNNTVIYDGYEIVRVEGKAVRYHRHLMEKKIGRKLNKEEIVHHIDCDKLNNNIDNLFLCESTSEHNKIHDNLEKLAARMINAGLVVFCPELKEYLYVGIFPESYKALMK